MLLDEIQAAGEVLAKLRWFAEEMPELPVVAAGSLLGFTLADHDFSMHVGRVTFRHMEPLGFQEHLHAHGQDALLKSIATWRTGKDLSAAAHEKAWRWFERFSMVCGMPEVAAADVGGANPQKCRELQKDLLAAARICPLVRYSAGNGLPLGAVTKVAFRKAALLDVGLLHALLNTPASAAFPAWSALPPDFRSRISEQMAAQQLRLSDPAGAEEPELHYWQRGGGRPGEIDYLAAVAGRCDSNPPGEMHIEVVTTQGDPARYDLLNLPLYLLWNLPRILSETF